MLLDRRRFLRLLGSLAAALASAGCAGLARANTPAGEPLPQETLSSNGEAERVAGTPAVPLSASDSVAPTAVVSAPSYSDPRWQELSRLWHGLDQLAVDGHEFEWYLRLREQLLVEHELALSELAAGGSLDPLIADEMQVAYAEVTRAIWGPDCHLSCDAFEPSVKYQAEGRADLLRQATALVGAASSESADALIEEARPVMARDIAYLMLTEPQQKALGEYIKRESGDAWPSLAELDLYVSAQCLEAARVLCELLAAPEGAG